MQRHFDVELKELKLKLLKMASLGEISIAKSVKALIDCNKKLAQKVIDSDEHLNMFEIEIEELCLKLLALRQPIAGDLRFITSGMKLTKDLERIGDLSVNIAERTLDILKDDFFKGNFQKSLIDITHMADVAQKMLKDSLHAFVNGNAELAQDVCCRDDIVDQLNNQIFRELLVVMLLDPKQIKSSLSLILVGRNLERIADHATNIGEEVVYIVKGKTIKHHIEEKKALLN